MKKLYFLLFFFLVIGITVNAQKDSSKTPTTQKTDVKDAYACPKCFATGSKAGECAHCKIDMVKVGSYFCPHCYMETGKEPGKCSMCDVATQKMTAELIKKHTSKG